MQHSVQQAKLCTPIRTGSCSMFDIQLLTVRLCWQGTEEGHYLGFDQTKCYE